MHTSENKTKDDGLIGNEQIEEAIAALQKKPSEELLAHALTVVRSRMRGKGSGHPCGGHAAGTDYKSDSSDADPGSENRGQEGPGG